MSVYRTIGPLVFVLSAIFVTFTSINKSIFFTLTRSVHMMLMMKLNWDVLFNDIN